MVDDWHDEPWPLTAGRFGAVIDVSSAPDGTVYVLDGQNRAVHVLAPNGAPRAVFHVPYTWDGGNAWQPRRLDVGFDGRLYVIVDGYRDPGGPYRTRIDRLMPSGVLEHSFEVFSDVPQAYDDIAVRSDGRIYLSRNGPGSPFIQWPGPTPTPPADGSPVHAVEVYGPSGRHLASLAPPELGVPGSLDVDGDGTLYVVNRVPSPWSDPPEGPTPTPRPSFGSPPLALQQQPETRAVEGVLVFNPDHSVRETVPFLNAEDVAAGPAGVFVSRNVEIFALRESEPLHVGPTGRVYAAYFRRVALSVDATADGRLLAGMNHCYFQGVVLFNDPGLRPSPGLYVGQNDAPFLEGPPYPARLSASEQVAVLQGRFFGSGLPPERIYAASNYLVDPQTVQRWTRQGQRADAAGLRSQMGVCSGSGAWWARDVAVDGSDVYTVDPNLVQFRPDDGLPQWTAWPGVQVGAGLRSNLAAVAAHDGTVVVLDTGAAMVHVLDRAGSVVDGWSIAGGGDNALPADIAVHGDRVFLADLGRSRVSVFRLDGTPSHDFPTHDGPAAIDVGPDGSVFVLGRGAWGFRYEPDGRLLAAWSMPERGLEALDIAVDMDGRVYVSYVEARWLGPPSVGRAFVLFDIMRSGVWVFEETPSAAPPETAPDACQALPDKWASPRRFPLGMQTEVGLRVDGRCPGSFDPVQVMVVLDTSRSMNFDQAIDRARDALAVLLSHLDPRAAQAGLVTFDDGAALVAPLSRDMADLAALVAARQASGATRLAAGLSLAHQELLPPRGDQASRRLILVVTDGVFGDDPLEAAAAARADGIELFALVLPTYEFNSDRQAALDLLTADPERVFVDPDPSTLVALVDGMIRYRVQPGLFATIRVDDVVPENMRYVMGSAVPPALWDAATRTLSWTMERVAADRPVQLRYRLEPLEPGTWPTNVVATASYLDALGQEGELVFPVPMVEVFASHQPIFLPFAAARSCFRSTRPMDVVLVVDTSGSMAEPTEDGTTKLDAARRAALAFLDLLRWPPDRAALVSFDRAARVHADLTADRAALAAAVAALDTAAGTHIDLGLAEARQALRSRRSDAAAVVILLTDGLNNAGPEPVLAQADRLRADGVLVYTVGLGDEIDADLLRAAATTPERYYASPTSRELEEIYRQIVARLACE